MKYLLILITFITTISEGAVSRRDLLKAAGLCLVTVVSEDRTPAFSVTLPVNEKAKRLGLQEVGETVRELTRRAGDSDGWRAQFEFQEKAWEALEASPGKILTFTHHFVYQGREGMLSVKLIWDPARNGIFNDDGKFDFYSGEGIDGITQLEWADAVQTGRANMLSRIPPR